MKTITQPYKNMMSNSNGRIVSPSQAHAIATVKYGPKLAMMLIINSEIYMVLTVLIRFDHALWIDLKTSAWSFYPFTSS